MSDTDPRAAAIRQTREHGLWGRADSPPDWQAALDGATPGDPVLVRSPDDRRDDFYLVPMRPGKPAARSAWVILDRDTLKLREASLLDHWPAPAFPDEKDRNRLSQTPLILPDGTRAQFRAEELQPNLKNFVWKPTEAAILPYWPVKEFIAAHPLTREPVSIFLTQDGNILTDLDHENSQSPSTPPKVRNHRIAAVGGILILSAVLAIAVRQFLPSKVPSEPALVKEPTRNIETPDVKPTVKPTEISPAPTEPEPVKLPTRKPETPDVKPSVKPPEISPPHAEPAPVKLPTRNPETPEVNHTVKSTETTPVHEEPDPIKGPTGMHEAPDGVKLPDKPTEVSPPHAEPARVKVPTRKLEPQNVKPPVKPTEVSPPRAEPAPVKGPTRKLETPNVKPTDKPTEASLPRAEPAPVKGPTRKIEIPNVKPTDKPPETSPPNTEPPPSTSSP